MGKTNQATVLALLLSFAVVIHFVESIIPLPIPVPGVRLGLANIITLLTLLLLGFPSALIVSLGRVFLGGMLAGTFLGFGFWLSLAGSVVSCLLMALVLPLMRNNLISVVSVSIIGAVSHNMAQLIGAGIVMQNMIIVRGYFPFLILAAVPTGFLTGVAVLHLEKLTRKSLRFPVDVL